MKCPLGDYKLYLKFLPMIRVYIGYQPMLEIINSTVLMVEQSLLFSLKRLRAWIQLNHCFTLFGNVCNVEINTVLLFLHYTCKYAIN